MKKILPTLAEVYNILDQDDSQRGFSNVITPPAAFQVSENFNPNIGQPAIYYVTSRPDKSRPIGSHCNRVGHIAGYILVFGYFYYELYESPNRVKYQNKWSGYS